MKSNKTLIGVSCLTITNIFWGLTDILVAYLARGQLTTWIHSFLGAIFLLSFLYVLKIKFNYKEFLSAFPIGFHRAVTWSVLFYAFGQANPAISIAILSFSGVFAIVFYSKFIDDKPDGVIYLLASIGVIGVILISVDDFQNITFNKGAVIALIILPISAAGTLVLRRVQIRVPANKSGLYTFIWASLLLFPTLFFVDVKFAITGREFYIFVLLAVLASLGHLLYGISQTHTSYSSNILIANIHTPFTAIFAFFILRQTLTYFQLLGIGITIIIVTSAAFYEQKYKNVDLLTSNDDI